MQTFCRRNPNTYEVNMDYKYEMHCHTLPVSACSKVSAREMLSSYKLRGYDGVFITNHFVDGCFCFEMANKSYEDKINFYFDCLDEAKKIGDEIGIKVFGGIESSYYGMDALVYCLDREWYLSHPEIMSMPRKKQLQFFRDSGGFVTQAHPFRSASYVDHIQLFVDNVDAFEVFNANNRKEENRLAEIVADSYGLIKLYGSDNHHASGQKLLGGVKLSRSVNSEAEFFDAVKRGEHENFTEYENDFI